MKAAVDGIIISGEGHFDEAFLTGEARSKKKIINDNILAGSINLDGAIKYKATKIGKDSTISEIVNLVKEAMMSKAKISNLADKISMIFVPFIFLTALIGFIMYLIFTNFNTAIIKFATVLVVACPCALGLATPLALVVAHGKYASLGILVKNNQILEEIVKINYISFDKTGTLTYGNYKVDKFYNYSNYNDIELLNIISNIENESQHPIKKAFNITKKLDVSSFKVIDGIGVTARLFDNEYIIGNNKLLNENIKNDHQNEFDDLVNNSYTAIYVVENLKVIAIIGLKDIIKKDSKELINNLHKLNINTCILTGDNELTAKSIADELEINDIYANVYPKDKGVVINDLKNKGYTVMMIGDGINDAVSLANANIGVSVNKSCDVASDSADIIITKDEINNIYNLFKVAKKAFRIIKENLFWAFFYNIIMIPIALGALEFVGIKMMPMWASLAMMASSLTVIFNSLRIRR